MAVSDSAEISYLMAGNDDDITSSKSVLSFFSDWRRDVRTRPELSSIIVFSSFTSFLRARVVIAVVNIRTNVILTVIMDSTIILFFRPGSLPGRPVLTEILTIMKVKGRIIIEKRVLRAREDLKSRISFSSCI